MWAPMIGEEFCDTDGATLMTAGIDASWFLLFAGLLVAIAIAALLEVFPLIGWLNSVAFLMMGKIPVAIFFVGIILSVITLATGATGISPPPCLPIIG